MEMTRNEQIKIYNTIMCNSVEMILNFRNEGKGRGRAGLYLRALWLVQFFLQHKGLTAVSTASIYLPGSRYGFERVNK